jgi:hypothetical protein
MTKDELSYFESAAKKLYRYAENYDGDIAGAFEDFWNELLPVLKRDAGGPLSAKPSGENWNLGDTINDVPIDKLTG